MSVSDVQHARAIINTVGEVYQQIVAGHLQAGMGYCSDLDCERKAQAVLENMGKEYVLNVANALWADKQDAMPQWLKDYDKKEAINNG